jgi:phosphatidylinositol alpha-mannosyltransferase
MRVALVSPYSWTYPGGVTRHIEALATELSASGHDVRVLAPFDPDVRRTAVLHRGARPQVRPEPEWLVSLGPTIGWPSNGAVSNLAHTPYAVSTLRRELKAGDFDVVHLHEPVAPVVGWDALTSTDTPLVGRSTATRRARRRTRSRRCWAPAASSTTCRRGSRSPRPPPGPAGASTAAPTG